jgi:DNA repair protein RecO (recombination protein O)
VGLYRDQGVVLRTYKLGEADRIVVFMTEGRGKVRAVAKGVRKTKSRFGARLEPPTNTSLLFYEGRELDIVTQADTLDHFRPIRDDLGRMTDAMAMLEVVDQVAQEREANPRLYQMLVAALRTLAGQEPRSPLLTAAFFWKLLSLEGAAPLLDTCGGCGTPALTDGMEVAVDGKVAVDETVAVGGKVGVELVAFDLAEGGALCRTCWRGVRSNPGSPGRGPARPALPVSPAALRLIGRILGGELGPALAEPAGPVTTEVCVLATHSMEQHLERRLRVIHSLE